MAKTATGPTAPTIKVRSTWTNEVEEFKSAGAGAYPYECRAKDKHPTSTVYFNGTGGWVASHQLDWDTTRQPAAT